MLTAMNTVKSRRLSTPRRHVGRRTQADRSAETRQKLLRATVECLAERGYAGATLSAIVTRAGVSRGAQVHHFGSRHMLMMEAAADVFQQAYRDLGEVLLALPDPSQRLEKMIVAAWQQLFSTTAYRAYQALLNASHHDLELAAALSELVERIRTHYEPAVDHYFQASGKATVKPRTLFVQLACFLNGMATQAHLARDPAIISYQLKAYAALMSTQIKARSGVQTRPPRRTSGGTPPVTS